MFTLRAATPKDVDILASIEAQSFPEAEMATRESFEKRLAVFPDYFLILFEDGEPVGLIDGMITNNRTISDDMFENASLHVPNGRWQSVFGLAVIPSKRHQGCASTLMRAFIEKARQGLKDWDEYLRELAEIAARTEAPKRTISILPAGGQADHHCG